ncbi:MAG: 5,10-methylenetetrahydrofolate reductase [Candidatus Aerophobetes bacterium ADurb.Bin490]|nr:MAG: 5,10-methylenetetrahydrofolate reductase [Candidatus Aerophobetes bacterium ADurb.Bin490]HPI03285.1 methylenetetrahydrofolate reductase [NAD(P)H] [Candidatus Goldiibacteriota bacterium]HRQ44178.1 methylenetetrahydrofolate reductase [NAD(P)H] [Candidatus Goldiibacteriota bacterium]
MKIADILRDKKFVFSMEIFPPKPDSDISVIYNTLDGLKDLKPDFISITFGAGGGTRTRTVEIAERIENHYKIPCMAHLTCIGATKASITEILNELKAKNIQNIMALRGDLPEGVKNPLKDFKYAADLVKFIKKKWDFCVGVAGYPEKHPQAKDMKRDLKHLKEKVKAGASFITTQLFLNNDHYFNYVKMVREAGITVPVLPGIMTATKLSSIERMTKMCGVEIPERFKTATSTCAIDNPVCDETVKYTVGQINHLIKNGVPGIHLYTMNRVEQNRHIYEESDISKMRQ